jgi:ribonucleoside-diphosphate reductase alpha chain
LRGTFVGWKADSEFYRAVDGTLEGTNDFYQMLVDEFPGEAELMYRYGRRNVNWSTIAPAGSTSIIAQTEDFPNMSAGCEPQFMCYYMRSKKVNPDSSNVRVDYVDDNGDSWQEYPVVMGGFKQFIKNNWGELGLPYSEDPDFEQVEILTKEQIEDCYKQSPYFGTTANDIDWLKRVKIQGVLQRYTTSAISSTLNLPKDVTKKTVSDIYFAGWKEGVKGITIYRDGCRTGVLNASSKSSRFEPKDAVKRPQELLAETHYSTSKGESYHVIIGLLEDKPYEIFIDNSENRYSKEGKIVKEARGTYVFKNGGDPVTIKDFMSPEQQAITRLVSMALRHGTAIVFVVEQLQKIDGDMFTFAKSLARVLKKYIPDGAPSTETCQDCGSENVKFQEGCSTCMECGSSKCG